MHYMKMEEFKMCSDGEFMPVSLPCPPPYSGPYYYYPYESIPFPPADAGYTDSSSSGGAGAPISAGAVAGIIILVSFIFVMMCVLAVKCRNRSLIFGNIMRSLSRNAGNYSADQGEHILNGSGHDHNMLVSIAGGGLEEKLVSLLPVFEYVLGLQEAAAGGKDVQESKKEIRSSSESCAVCLSSFEEKDIVRVLPKCHHTFHLHCIDTWFQSHANCPLCRERITLQTIQLYFKGPDRLPAGPCNCPSDHQNDQHPPEPYPAHDQHVPARLLTPPAGTLISCANRAAIIADHHQNDQHPAKYHQPSSPGYDQQVNNEQTAGLACGRLQGVDNHQNLLSPADVSTAADDHHQIDVLHPAEPCRYQHACGHNFNDQLQDAGRHRGGLVLDDEGLYDQQKVTPAVAAPISDDQSSAYEHASDHKMSICFNPGSLNQAVHADHEDNCADIHHSKSYYCKLYSGNSDRLLVSTPHDPVLMFKRSLSTSS